MIFRYESLATNLQQAIAKGVFPVGSKLPSIRKMGENQGLSIATVMQAYARLEEQGLIDARPKSGYFVRRPQEERQILPKTRPRPRPGDVAVSKVAMDVLRAANRPEMIPLGAAAPGPGTLPLADLNRCMARAARMNQSRTSRYEVPEGAPELRGAIARILLDSGCNADPDEIVITNGAQEAITVTLRAITKPGDIVAIESPTYFGIVQALEALDLKALELPTDPRRGVDIDALESALKKYGISACVLVPNHQNPLGFCMSDADKKRVANLLAFHGVPLLEDDVFGATGVRTPRPRAAKSFDDVGNIILCGSFSKTVSPALRIGWAWSGRYRDQILREKFLLNMSTATIPQLALADYLTGNRYRRATQSAALKYAKRLRLMRDLVLERFPEGTTCGVPDGGFFLWVELPEVYDTSDLFVKALADGVAFSPGRLFTCCNDYHNSLRLSCATLDEQQIPDAISRLADIIDGNSNSLVCSG